MFSKSISPKQTDPFPKWLPIINSFVIIKISLTNLVFELIIQKNEFSEANLNAYKRILNWQPFMKRVYEPFPQWDVPAGNHGICIHKLGLDICRLHEYNYHDPLRAHLTEAGNWPFVSGPCVLEELSFSFWTKFSVIPIRILYVHPPLCSRDLCFFITRLFFFYFVSFNLLLLISGKALIVTLLQESKR